jgi:hypothetical protein
MAIPSGSGTEVLKRASYNANSGAWRVLITGVANHIYTVLSVTACERGNATETIDMQVDIDAAGSNQVTIFVSQTLTPYATYVWNDKFVLTGTDQLEVYNTAGDVDWYVSYIDQDWS